MTEERNTIMLPTLALRGLTVYPKMLIHFDVGREASIIALEEAMTSNQSIFLVAQKDMRVEMPEQKDLFTMGTVANVRQILRLPVKSIRVMVEGLQRGRLHSLKQTQPHLMAEIEEIEEPASDYSSVKAEALARTAYELFEQYTELSPRMSGELLLNVMSSEDPGYIADFIAQNIIMRISDKQAVLEELRPLPRLRKLTKILHREVEILALEQEIQNRVSDNLSQNQRDMVLREQLRVIQRELGETEQGRAKPPATASVLSRQSCPKRWRKSCSKRLRSLSASPSARRRGR